MPLCVRDDASEAAVVIQHSVTAWQAYNRWGGFSLYYGNRNGAQSFVHAPTDSTYAIGARIVSFDRPYDHDWASGAADFVGNELPVIYHAEHSGSMSPTGPMSIYMRSRSCSTITAPC